MYRTEASLILRCYVLEGSIRDESGRDLNRLSSKRTAADDSTEVWAMRTKRLWEWKGRPKAASADSSDRPRPYTGSSGAVREAV